MISVRTSLTLAALVTVLMVTTANAQLPILSRQINLQHNGNGKEVRITAPTLDSTYQLSLPSAQGVAGSVLTNDGSGSLSWTTILTAAMVNGTTNYLTKFTSPTSLGTSIFYDDGSNVGIGTTSPGARIQINAASASGKGLILRGAASATANLLEVQNSSGSLHLSIDPNGDLTKIHGVTYSWPTAKPDSATSTGSSLGTGVMEVSHTGALSWRQMAVATATLNFPITATRTSSDLNITVNGAASGDAVSLGVPNAAVLTNTCFTAWVSAANTVTVRFNNYDNADKDPASAVFKVTIMK